MKVKVILDVAHGKDVKGKRSPDESLLEWKWSREIADLVEKELDDLGIGHIRTVNNDSEPGIGTRCRTANKIMSQTKDTCFLISIHVNAASSDGKWHEAKGWSVFVSPNASKNSKQLATFLGQAATKEGVKVRRQYPKVDYWVQNLAMCRDTKMPAVLIENFFMDNKEDCEFLLSQEGKETVKRIIIEGIKNYINYLETN